MLLFWGGGRCQGPGQSFDSHVQEVGWILLRNQSTTFTSKHLSGMFLQEQPSANIFFSFCSWVVQIGHFVSTKEMQIKKHSIPETAVTWGGTPCSPSSIRLLKPLTNMEVGRTDLLCFAGLATPEQQSVPVAVAESSQTRDAVPRTSTSGQYELFVVSCIILFMYFVPVSVVRCPLPIPRM